MSDVEIKFEREERDGIVAVGTYLIDAMKRFGIRPEDVCINGEHHCAVTIHKGAELLSPRTEEETKYFETNGGGKNERLACQVKMEKAGSISVMTKKKKKDEAAGAAEEVHETDFKKEFTDMPLEKKIANLVQLEAIALGETLTFVANSPYLIFEKIGDVMAEFGMKFERQAKEATRPKEHTAKEDSENGDKAKADEAKKEDEPVEESVVDAVEPEKTEE